MTNFSGLRDLCLRLFGAPNLSAEHIVNICVDDAVSVWPHGREGVRVAFTLTYTGVIMLDGPTHAAVMDLLGASGDGPWRIVSVTRPGASSTPLAECLRWRQ